jgi:Bacterial regulatory helix-turn-helix protein, lysR family
MIERQQFQAFVTLAGELHFGRAAERMHGPTARVSQTVRSLERRVGAPLFARTSPRVELTGSGSGCTRTFGRRGSRSRPAWRGRSTPAAASPSCCLFASSEPPGVSSWSAPRVGHRPGDHVQDRNRVREGTHGQEVAASAYARGNPQLGPPEDSSADRPATIATACFVSAGLRLSTRISGAPSERGPWS